MKMYYVLFVTGVVALNAAGIYIDKLMGWWWTIF